MNKLPQEHFSVLLRLSVLLSFFVFPYGCASKYLSIDQADDIEDFTINRIAIIPFTFDRTSFDTGTITGPSGAEILTALMEKKLERFYYLTARDKIVALLIETHSLQAQQIATMLSKKLAVDGVLMGIVTRYQQRKGNNYSVSQPASVAFELYFMDGKTGKILWSACFDKTQKSLSEDVSNIYSFFKEEWRWLTAEELMELGVNELLDTFPGMHERKEQQKSKPLSSPWPSDMG